MYLDVYIGWLEEDGSLDRGGDPSIGNAPIRVSPFFPDGSQAFSLLKDKIEAGEFKSAYVCLEDWFDRGFIYVLYIETYRRAERVITTGILNLFLPFFSPSHHLILVPWPS